MITYRSKTTFCSHCGEEFIPAKQKRGRVWIRRLRLGLVNRGPSVIGLVAMPVLVGLGYLALSLFRWVTYSALGTPSPAREGYVFIHWFVAPLVGAGMILVCLAVLWGLHRIAFALGEWIIAQCR